MQVGIMQPYLFPYLGYFQLIGAVDKYVILDDVQYIKGGWINRNKILLNGRGKLFALPVKHAPHTLNINERYFADSFAKDKIRLLNLIAQAYAKAPFFDRTFPLVVKIFSSEKRNVAEFIANSLKVLCDYMRIKKTQLIISSTMPMDQRRKRAGLVIDIVKRLGSKNYINAIGGLEIYSKEYFRKRGIKLQFIKMNNIHYGQFENAFVPNLSIIDVLMFNSRKRVSGLLKQYQLV